VLWYICFFMSFMKAEKRPVWFAPF